MQSFIVQCNMQLIKQFIDQKKMQLFIKDLDVHFINLISYIILDQI